MPDGFRTDECGALAEGTWSNLETGPPLTLEGLQENFRRYSELPPATWQTRDEPMLRNLAGALREAFCRASCPCSMCASTGAADNVTDELLGLVRQGDEAGFRELAACVMPVEEIEECWAGARRRMGLASSPCQEPQFYSRPITELLQNDAR